MGKDNRIVDSTGNEAKVTAAGNRLQVRSDFESTYDLDDLKTVLDAIETLLGGTAKVKLWDGTDTLGVQSDGSLNTRAMGLYSGSQVQIQVDVNGKLVVAI